MIAVKNLLSIEDLVVRFYTYEGVVEALDGVNLNLREGETLGVVGETGCGKSVTSLSVLLLVPPPGVIERGKVRFVDESGAVNLLEQDEAYLRSMRGRDISMIFQEPRAFLNPVYTVKDQISEVLMLHRREELCQRALQAIERDMESGKANVFAPLEKAFFTTMFNDPESDLVGFLLKIPIVRRLNRRLDKEIRGEIVRLLKEMGMPDPERIMNMYPHELSGGMAQRVVIAMALACGPKLLIADEPTTNLDVTVQLQILNLVRELKQKFKSSIVYVTHDLGVVAELCERVAVMYAGNVVELANVMEIFKKPLHPYTRALLESIPRPGHEFKSIEGTVPSLINPPKGCRFNDRCSNAVEKCLREKPRLVEVEKEHFVQCHLYPGGS